MSKRPKTFMLLWRFNLNLDIREWLSEHGSFDDMQYSAELVRYDNINDDQYGMPELIRVKFRCDDNLHVLFKLMWGDSIYSDYDQNSSYSS